jgi:hypothetical protein
VFKVQQAVQVLLVFKVLRVQQAVQDHLASKDRKV